MTSLLCRLPTRLSVLVLWWPTRRKSIFAFLGKLSSNLLTIPRPLSPHILSHPPVEPSHLLLTDLFPGIQINMPRNGKEITPTIDRLVFRLSRPNRDHQKWHKNHLDSIPLIYLLRPNQVGRLHLILFLHCPGPYPAEQGFLFRC